MLSKERIQVVDARVQSQHIPPLPLRREQNRYGIDNSDHEVQQESRCVNLHK